MADGYHGLLAPWIGGAANSGTATQGYTGLLSFWSGGAANSGTATQGYTGLLSFWSGGAANNGAAPAVTPPRRPIGILLFGRMGLRDHRH